MTATTACRTCGTDPREGARFCDGCGAPITTHDFPAEYKQVTVLFADVVHSMDIAAAVGAERLREIMAELSDRCAAVVQRYGSTVAQWTGDGIMAVFGAPIALEDHAVRACLAALGLQEEAQRLAVDFHQRHGIDLQLRVGLNSGQVIAGEMGSGQFGYAAVGEQVGMAQRMESVAPPGGVMLSASTASLVEGAANLAGTELVHIKGVAQPVPARRLLGMVDGRRATGRAESNLVGRDWEMAAVEGLLARAIDGSGAVVGVVGPPGIGKSRLVREVSATAAARGVEVFSAFCESHASDVPFRVVAQLLRAATGVRGLETVAARDRVRAQFPDADPEDVLLLEDLLGIADPEAALAKVDPDARRRRLTALVNSASLARKAPTVYVVEDLHWIDGVSESWVDDFVAVVPQTHSLVLISYRPEYRGALSRVPGAQTIALAPLSDSETAALVLQLLGPDPSVAGLATTIAERAAGNPFFVEEMVRDLAERGVLSGARGSYACQVDHADAAVPATLQATIAARIDRLGLAAKQTLNAAAVIGLRFDAEQLALLDGAAELPALIAAELVDQVRFTPHAEYAFHHPLIRTVAYETQLKSDRAELHRRLATALQQRDPDSLDENAALIAEHFEAAGDLRAAFGWHMRAGAWAQARDIRSARNSWERARAVADRLPTDDPGRASMRIAPRTLLCLNTVRVAGSVADTGFDELRDLCTAAGDTVSLAIGMGGLMTTLVFHNRYREAARLASDCSQLLESFAEPPLTLMLLMSSARWFAGQAAEGLTLAQRVIDLAGGDPTKGGLGPVASPLAMAFLMRGSCRYCLGLPGWRDDLEQATEMTRSVDPLSLGAPVLYKYRFATHAGVLLPDATASRDTAEAMKMAEHSGDDFAVDGARVSRGLVLVKQGASHRAAGFALLAQFREANVRHGYADNVVRTVDTEIAKEKARTGDIDGAIGLARAVVDYTFDAGDALSLGEANRVFVEALLQRGTGADVEEAQAAIDRLAAEPTDPGYVLFEVPLLRLRALLARARGDDATYQRFRDRYRDMAKTLGFEGHIALADAMA
ncbi:AAA family ATPase [Mycobacterium paraense]|uniref:ATP-binding protein n=1 Tax=Mycobacterium paraense TaxID=767916 RepID=UPI000A147CA4|nr:adenylate/guanylate cyclase domain-containing protein [Mycobacterium paraense]MCV7443367.1 AAA family ATPase [Mycobacterium paraense]ORW40172.1 cyclase [Mycobacterium paraense]